MTGAQIHCTGLSCGCVSPTRLLLARFRQVCDARVWTHEDVAGVQAAVQEGLLGVRDVDATQRRFRERVGRNQGETIQAHLVDAVDSLKPGSDAKVRGKHSEDSVHFYTQNMGRIPKSQTCTAHLFKGPACNS